MATYSIQSITARQARVFNDATNEYVDVKVEPYHRDGKQMAYVCINKQLDAPIARYNIKDYTKPISLKSISLQARSSNNEAFDFSNFKFEE